ncbi:MAG: heavy metal translocating P-type ATPase [Coriobacteriales bacterium]|nr:heavy metal translocating P-type ATPase [Coriobacteriales bacterium]
MYAKIINDIPGRLRLRCGEHIFCEPEAYGVSLALMHIPGVRYAEVHEANGSILVVFDPAVKNDVLAAVRQFDVYRLPQVSPDSLDIPTSLATALENNRFFVKATGIVGWHMLRKLLLPAPVAAAYTVIQAIPFVVKGILALKQHKLTVEVLDATAISASILRGSFSDAGAVMMLLRLTEAMENHIQRRMRLALGENIITRAATVWLVKNGLEVEIPVNEIQEGDVLHIRSGSVLPVDGTVLSGEGEIDESSMTGEARLIHKDKDATVFAGTALEDGDLMVEVTAPPGKARIDGIVAMVEKSAASKAVSQGKAEHLADALVPVSLLAFLSIWGITRYIVKAMAVLMVDYSCAIRLSTPICVMSAMSEATGHGIVVKGGKYLESLAQADTVVFDKTGTLTQALPTLEKVIPLGSMPEDEVLRLAACIEEHFPHSVARAIVEGARARGLAHDLELHAEVEYIVAHGIKTTINGREAVIGSHHFVFEDSAIPQPGYLKDLIEREAPRSSVVYFALDGQAAGALCVSDPLRPEAASVLQKLRKLGITKIVMLTGDSQTGAANVAQELMLDEYYAQVLPEDKSSYVQAIREAGGSVIMVGDGINDSPALAVADVSVAMADASDIARAVADVSILNSSLESLVIARKLAMSLMRRVHGRYHFIVAFNTALIALGVAGILPISTAAYLHNASTLAVAASNTRHYLHK